MIIALSSPKPGSGVSTTAALLAVRARVDQHTVIVDCGHDQAALFNVATTPGTVHVDDGLDIVNAGDMTTGGQANAAITAAQHGAHVIVDAGRHDHPIHRRLADTASRLWVLRPCYLSMRRAARTDQRPDGVILLTELGRALTTRDVELTLAVPVLATLEVHPDIARTTDAGVLTGRPPHHACRSLEPLINLAEAQR